MIAYLRRFAYWLLGDETAVSGKRYGYRTPELGAKYSYELAAKAWKQAQSRSESGRKFKTVKPKEKAANVVPIDTGRKQA